jgi:hypothetical protein
LSRLQSASKECYKVENMLKPVEQKMLISNLEFLKI